MRQSETLFEIPPKPRSKPRKLMHVSDAGDCGGCTDGETDVVFTCRRCGYESEWIRMRTVTEAKRGLPCPKCNKKEKA